MFYPGSEFSKQYFAEQHLECEHKKLIVEYICARKSNTLKYYNLIAFSFYDKENTLTYII